MPVATARRRRTAPTAAPPPPGGSLGDALRNLQRYTQNEAFDNQGGGGGQFGPEIQFDTKGVEFGPWIRRFIAQVKRNWFIPYAAMSMKGHVVIQFNVHKDGSITDLQVVGAERRRRVQQRRVRRAVRIEPDAAAAAGVSRQQGVLHRHVLLQRRRRRGDPRRSSSGSSDPAARVHRLRRRPRAMKPLVVAVLGPTATGKSALALAIAERHGGEIINCDSTAVYRGFDIGTDKIAARAIGAASRII